MSESFKKVKVKAFTDHQQTAEGVYGLQHQLGYLATHYGTGSSSKSISSSVMSSCSHPDILLFMTTLALQITNSEGLRL